jgi:hypothetical protein
MNRIANRPSVKGFWPALGAKVAVALVVCAGVRVLVAQAPPAAGAFAVPVEQDANGNKRLVPLPAFYGDARARAAHNKLFTEKIRPVLTGQRPLADGRRDVENYYNMIYFPILTQTTDDALRTLSEERQRFVRDHLERSTPEARAVVAALARNTLANIVRDSFHHTVRYNAMLIISGLNDQEAIKSGNPTLPIPMATALPIILEEFKRPENSDAIKLAALLGLAWHLEWENFKPTTVPPAARKGDVIDELIKFVETKEPPEGRTADGHTWLRRRAVDALAGACLTKSDPKIAEVMDKLIRDESEPLALRCAVAQALGEMSLQAPAKLNVPSLAKELGYVALSACETELTQAIKHRKDEDERVARLTGTYSGEMGSGGYGGGMPGGGMTGMMGSPDGGAYPGGPGSYTGPRPMGGTTAGMPGEYGATAPDPSMYDPKHYRFDLIRRKIRQELHCVQIGLLGGEDHPRPKASAAAAKKDDGAKDGGNGQDKRGLFAVAKGNEKQVVDSVYYEVRDLIDVIENRATDTFQLDRELRKKMKNLENLIGKRVPAAAPASDEDLPTVAAPGKAAPPGKAAAGKGAPPPGKAPAVPAKTAPPKVTPMPAKAAPVPPKTAWRSPPRFAPNNVHGAVRR